jgi:endonuclease/exonuclease/phosphatase family metal-dependent hydrolase
MPSHATPPFSPVHRRRFLPCVAAALLLLIVGCAHHVPSKPIVVMTYNIHHGEGTDQRLDLPRIAEIIRRADPELVALQEVDNGTQRTGGVDQAAELGRLTGLQVTYGPAMDYQGGRYGNAILSREEPRTKRLVALPGSGGKHEPRSVVAISVLAKTVSGREVSLVFASTHLDFTAEPSDRLRQATIIAQAFANEQRPMILAGDFNCRPGSPPLNVLADQWRLTVGEETQKSIDHVLARPGDWWRVLEVSSLPETVASDHRPVVVKLELHDGPLPHTNGITASADPPARAASPGTGGSE